MGIRQMCAPNPAAEKKSRSFGDTVRGNNKKEKRTAANGQNKNDRGP